MSGAGRRRRTSSLALVGLLVLALLPAYAFTAAQDAPEPRRTSLACPPGEAMRDFPDIAGSVHAGNIRCIADLGIAQGKVGGTYAPRDRVRRDQMATFVVNTVETYTGMELPGGDADRFPDVLPDNVHRRAINKLAASGWIQGRPGGVYEPGGFVTRGQMARFIAGALSFLDDGDGTTRTQPPATSQDFFADDDGSVFEDDINRLAAQGIVGGFEDGTYRPSANVLRDQMASFIARSYDYAIEARLGQDAEPPAEFEESSRVVIEADALQVVNPDGDFRQGESGATGTWDLRLDRTNDLICYDITLTGVNGQYASPALTATHIHGAVFGEIGPPVVAFPNPQPLAEDPDTRRSTGCLDSTQPSFAETADMGGPDDPGRGFTVAELEDDPSAYYVDSHTASFPGGAVRGQVGSTDVFDVSLSWHDEVDDETGLFGVGEPGASGDALVVVFDADDEASGTANDEMCAAITTDASAPFDGGPGAHLHAGAFDENGPVVVGFPTPDADGVSTGCATEFEEGFSPADAAGGPDGFYVNVHSDDFPAGAVRGQLPGGTSIAADDVTSTWVLQANPDEVVGGGEEGASATFELTFDSVNDVVCYEIVSDGVTGAYSSPATTATHIHEGVEGEAGPPRVAFANPQPVDADDPDGTRRSEGCARVPQLTGTSPDGSDVDNGAGFDLAAIEDDPDGYYVDIHTEDFAPGAVRAQFGDLFVESSRVVIEADALQVVNPDGDFRQGESGATGTWDLRLDRDSNLICYDITLTGVTGDYASPALTATHIHGAVFGEIGPPVVAFPNPQPVAGEEGVRASSGCLDSTEPSFPDDHEMGGEDDPGRGFTVAELEDDPSEYYVDSHTEDFAGGAVRGQVGSTDVFDVSLSWHDEVDDETGLFGVGDPGASGDALVVVFDAAADASGTANDEVCAAITSDATGPFDEAPGVHIHEGAFDENGPVVVDLGIPDADGGATACATEFEEGFAPADLVADEDGYYVNLHSNAFPAGAVRGQLPGGTSIDTPTSTWLLDANPDEVVGGGQEGATATFELTFDSVNDVVCYEIVSGGVTGDYSSPATTATHIHEGDVGEAGPPRVAFANPTGSGEERASSGCARVPQLTGTSPDGSDVDNGAGFDLAAIEDDPDGYYVDIHTVGFEPGAVRAQFSDAARLAVDDDEAASPVSFLPAASSGAVEQVTRPATGQRNSAFGCHFESA